MIHTVGIDHSLAPGVVVGHATTHDWGHRPTTAPGGKAWSISFLPRSLRLEQLKCAIYTEFEAELFYVIDRYYQLQVDAIFPREYVAMGDDVAMVDDCKQGHAHIKHAHGQDFRMSTSHKFESVKGIICHCVCWKFLQKYFQSALWNIINKW